MKATIRVENEFLLKRTPHDGSELRCRGQQERGVLQVACFRWYGERRFPALLAPPVHVETELHCPWKQESGLLQATCWERHGEYQ